MPFVTLPACFEGYPLSRIPGSLSERLRQDPRWETKVRGMTYRLECFCELTNQTLVGQPDESAKELLGQFCAAWFSRMFSGPEIRSPWNALHWLRRALPASLQPFYPCTPNKSGWPKEFRDLVRAFDEIVITGERATFWQGWIAENRSGDKCGLNLWRFWNRFGAKRTHEMFSAVQSWMAKGHATNVPVIEEFCETLVQAGRVDFNDSSSIGQAIVAFLPEHFRKRASHSIRARTIARQWRTFSRILSDHLLGYAWASPIPAIPLPVAPPQPAGPRVKRTASGKVVTASLLTPIPLAISDSEAKELLFRDIRRDTDALLSWARLEVRMARERFERRKSLAERGIPTTVSAAGHRTGKIYRLSIACPEWITHAAATFESFGFDNLYSARQTYPTPLSNTAWELGLPTPTLLLAYATVLVGTHPQITPSFLSTLEIVNARGHETGLVQTDAGWYLRGVKKRRGAKLAQQDVLLTAETLQCVRDLIALTAPLREWLRKSRSRYWRRLFVATPSMGAAPNRWNPSSHTYGNRDVLAARFSAAAAHADARSLPSLRWLADPGAAKYLSDRFGLRQLRASAGVLVYFETGSVEAMAKALGHKDWKPSLLNRYLPSVLQTFFTERWLRLFQSGLICEAMQGSPYLLESSCFDSIEALDTFLENHALRRIPAHLADPDHVGGTTRAPELNDRIVFGIEVGVLTILMSIEAAVRTANELPCGRAMMWARISERLIPHLETQTEQPEFRAMVAEARQHVRPQLVDSLIHG